MDKGLIAIKYRLFKREGKTSTANVPVAGYFSREKTFPNGSVRSEDTFSWDEFMDPKEVKDLVTSGRAALRPTMPRRVFDLVNGIGLGPGRKVTPAGELGL
jgi:hypothetical protein